ncbi:MAG: hypothetical protein L0332_17305, partial [Chloroflexi bacterium]|nr:hypothetical protein [Chloroflexota bacterium]
GLDCFSPTLTGMVGQELPALGAHCDWIKVMAYIRAYGPASIPFELHNLAGWLVASAGMGEAEALSWLAGAAGWSLPARSDAVRRGALSNTILTTEMERGHAARPPQLLAGLELVEMPGVAELDPTQIQADLATVAAAGVEGVVLSWDLWHMPLERLELVRHVVINEQLRTVHP